MARAMPVSAPFCLFSEHAGPAVGNVKRGRRMHRVVRWTHSGEQPAASSRQRGREWREKFVTRHFTGLSERDCGLPSMILLPTSPPASRASEFYPFLVAISCKNIRDCHRRCLTPSSILFIHSHKSSTLFHHRDSLRTKLSGPTRTIRRKTIAYQF